MIIKKYKTIQSPHKTHFDKLVNKHLEYGWELLDESNNKFGQFLKKYYGEFYQRKGTYGDEDYKIPDLYNYDVSLLILNDYKLINTKPSIDDSS